MPRRRIILIPPSEGKALGGEGPTWEEAEGATDHPLHAHRRTVVDALTAALGRELADRAAAASVLGVKGDALDRALDADAGLDAAATLPAIERYDGVLYQHLDATSFDARTRARLVRSVRILSGLWGVLRPDEAIPDYRLKMGATLPGLGKLSAWWRRPLSEHLAAEIRSAEVWNLLPQEHAAAVRVPRGTTVLTATFLRPGRDGSPVAVSHWNKALKGALVAHLLATPAARAEDLVDWEHPAGYVLDPASLRGSGPRELRFVARA